ncbi:hypothetical protein NP493_239g10035 [Ridgeia piscesae]|uniref:Uncharacterized protein n=1 Tax=Ridgeia piscesae TaxID=27915 RepID=A0AAD9NZI5_RIDPI|nr:hypothetical protein NP493_239g10035 [Ridgeia piscesae]
MGKLSCGCLNVTIHTNSSDQTPVNLTQLGLKSTSTEGFFAHKLSQVQQSLEGIQIEHEWLVQMTECCGWVVCYCANCHTWTHASHPQSSRVLVTDKLQSDPVVIEGMKQNPGYSQLYGVILRGDSSSYHAMMVGVESGKYENLQKTLATIQEKLTAFIRAAETATKERIRQFEREQQHALSELQSKARREKNELIAALLEAADRGSLPMSGVSFIDDAVVTLQDSPEVEQPGESACASELTDDLADTNITDVMAMEDTNAADPSNDVEDMSRASLKKKHLSSSSDDNPASKHRFQRGFTDQQVTSVDADGVLDFDLAFGDDSTQPFYESDDDLAGADEPPEKGRVTKKQDYTYSTSVPISVPLWGRRSVTAKDEDDDNSPLDPESMAASIRALAKSVHGGTSDLFGDLPRPPRQLNMADFGNI